MTIIYGKLILGFLLCLDSWISVASHFIVSFINDHEIEYQTCWAQILQELAFKKPVAQLATLIFATFSSQFHDFFMWRYWIFDIDQNNKRWIWKEKSQNRILIFDFKSRSLFSSINEWQLGTIVCTYKSLFISVCYKIIHTHLWQVNYPKKVIKVDFKTTFTTCSTIY